MKQSIQPVSQAYFLDDPNQLLTHLQRSFDVMQLVKDKDNSLYWSKSVEPDAKLFFGADSLPKDSLKGLFFANNEPLYTFDGETFQSVQQVIRPLAIFGAQACDLNALAYQDQFFAQDPQYQQRRESALIIGIDCESPCDYGFCVQVNAGPHVNQGMADIVLSRLHTEDPSEPYWFLIVQSQNGVEAIAGMSIKSANENLHKLREQKNNRLVGKFPIRAYIDNGIEYLNAGKIPFSVWQALGEDCQKSAGCVDLCPTCSCYTLNEKPSESGDSANQGYSTIRSWDACLHEDFQQEASGHNPGHDPAKRVERFWFHKFSNEYLAEFERFGCVGCGRCEQVYPGTFGVHTVMRRINQSCIS